MIIYFLSHILWITNLNSTMGTACLCITGSETRCKNHRLGAGTVGVSSHTCGRCWLLLGTHEELWMYSDCTRWVSYRSFWQKIQNSRGRAKTFLLRAQQTTWFSRRQLFSCPLDPCGGDSDSSGCCSRSASSSQPRSSQLREPQFFSMGYRKPCLNLVPEGNVIFITILISNKPTVPPEGGAICHPRLFPAKHPWKESLEQRTVCVFGGKMCRNTEDPLRNFNKRVKRRKDIEK